MIINSNLGNPDNAAGNIPIAWKNTNNTVTSANANDIVQYDGNNWVVMFDSQATTTEEYVTNINTGIQYKWVEGLWQKSWEGIYTEGYWLLII